MSFLGKGKRGGRVGMKPGSQEDSYLVGETTRQNSSHGITRHISPPHSATQSLIQRTNTSSVACFAIYKLSCRLNLWERIDIQNVCNEYLNN